MNETMLRNALYNTHSASGASVDYGKGIVVGCVSGLMASGESFDDAWYHVKEELPKDYRPACIPEGWNTNV